MSNERSDDVLCLPSVPQAAPSSLSRKKALPVLLLPGFMSSGLQVNKSTHCPSWVGKRLWVDLASLGFSSLHNGGAIRKEKTNEDDDDEYYDMTASQRLQLLKCSSKWVHHLSLSHDMIHERPGIQVRAIPGLTGVDYLLAYSLTKHASYVFGPVINVLLKTGGYRAGVNLDACPYDWRLPPCILQQRDAYFTSTMNRVERMFTQNDGTPVVIVCHSLGCKTAQYFFTFAKENRGQQWLDTYIHTYFPVGAPHLGAPKCLRAMIDGDKMGLDAFLSKEEGLVLGRSLGSVPWLLPKDSMRSVPPVAFVRREAYLVVTVSPMYVLDLLRERKRRSLPSLRLVVSYGKQVLMTEFQPTKGFGNGWLSFPHRFLFGAPPDLGHTTDNNSDDSPGRDDNTKAIKVSLQERGMRAAKKGAETNLPNKQDNVYQSSILCCPVRSATRSICCTFQCLTFFCRLVYKTLVAGTQVVLATANESATAAGMGTDLTLVQEVELKDIVVSKTCQGCASVTMKHILDSALSDRAKPRKTICTVHVQFIPHADSEFANFDHFSHYRRSNLSPAVRHKSKATVEYKTHTATEILKKEGLTRAVHVLDDYYDADPLGPRDISARDAPPVKRVKAVYGVNLPTEVGAVYRRKAVLLPIVDTGKKVKQIHKLDVAARSVIAGLDENVRGKHIVRGGIVFETRDTAQLVTKPFHTSNADMNQKGISISGDGTVPYYSLQHCRSWQGQCDVHVVELEGAEHREILADTRFHKVLVDYVTKEQHHDEDKFDKNSVAPVLHLPPLDQNGELPDDGMDSRDVHPLDKNEVCLLKDIGTDVI